MVCRGAEARKPDIIILTSVVCAVHLNINKTSLRNDNSYAIFWLACYRKALQNSHVFFNTLSFFFSAILQTSST